ncbi:hypothetical protein ABBQ32_008667 [Trebouxia sp. C0010 RCD-2024]
MNPRQSDTLLPKLALLAVAWSQPDFKHIAAIVSGATDRQNVACAEWSLLPCIYCSSQHSRLPTNSVGPHSAWPSIQGSRCFTADFGETIYQIPRSLAANNTGKLAKPSKPESCALLAVLHVVQLHVLALCTVLSTWSSVYMSKNVCACKRCLCDNDWLSRRHVLLIIGRRAFPAKSLRQSIRGMSTNLLLACWANGNNYAIYLRDASLAAAVKAANCCAQGACQQIH